MEATSATTPSFVGDKLSRGKLRERVPSISLVTESGPLFFEMNWTKL